MKMSSVLCMLVLFLLVSTSIGIPLEPEYVPTPVGYMLRHCVHTIPSGANVRHDDKGMVRVNHERFSKEIVLPKCDTQGGKWPMILPKNSPFPPDYDGWLQYTAFNHSTGLNDFVGYFSVPERPQQAPDVLYIFTGLQNIDWIPKVDPLPEGHFDIIQPVLQYPSQFANKWSMRSWYVTLDAGALASDEILLEVGDLVWGNMTRTGPESWIVVSQSKNTGKKTVTTVTNERLSVQPWAYNTIECYGCRGCETYPSNTCVFSDLVMHDAEGPVTPTWIVNPKPQPSQKCHESTKVVSPDSVIFGFQ